MDTILMMCMLIGGCSSRTPFCTKQYTGIRTWTSGHKRSWIDYIAVDNRLKREVQDAKVVTDTVRLPYSELSFHISRNHH